MNRKAERDVQIGYVQRELSEAQFRVAHGAMADMPNAHVVNFIDALRALNGALTEYQKLTERAPDRITHATPNGDVVIPGVPGEPSILVRGISGVR